MKMAHDFFKDSLVGAALITVASTILSPIAYYTSKLVFVYGVPAGLMGITFITSLYGIIKGRMWKTAVVTLKADNLKEFQDLIDKYLDPNIEIKN